VELKLKNGGIFDSGMVMFPGGHARNDDVPLNEVLQHKFKMLAKIALDK
jgi:hypothetical protein